MPILEDDSWDSCLCDLLPLAIGCLITSIVIILDQCYGIYLGLISEKGIQEYILFVVCTLLILIEIWGVVAAIAQSESSIEWFRKFHTLVVIGLILSLIAQIVTSLIDKFSDNHRTISVHILTLFIIFKCIAIPVGIWGRSVYASSETRLSMRKPIWKKDPSAPKPKAKAAEEVAAPAARPPAAAAHKPVSEEDENEDVDIDDEEISSSSV